MVDHVLGCAIYGGVAQLHLLEILQRTAHGDQCGDNVDAANNVALSDGLRA